MMTGFRKWLENNLSNIYRALLFLMAVLVIVQLFPRLPRFGFEFQTGRPWTYNDLIASFNFAILKSPAELEAEKEQVMSGFRPLFSFDRGVAEKKISSFIADFASVADSLERAGQGRRNPDHLVRSGQMILDTVFQRGIIFLDGEFLSQPPEHEIRLITNQVAQVRRINDFFTISQAYHIVEVALESAGLTDDADLKRLIENSLDHNVFYNADLTRLALETEMNNIAVTRGMVQQGEKIISKGELISPEKYRILESYRSEYVKITEKTANLYLQYAGRVLLVGISMTVLALFLYVFRRNVFSDNRRIFLILLTILFMSSLTSLMIRTNVDYLLLLPVCIVPVVIRAFFDNRLALYVHINTIILIGIMVPGSFEFVFLQFIAGIVAILSMASLRRRSQLFLTVSLIFLTYSAVNLGLSLAHSAIGEFNLINYIYFAGSALLTLFAYPIIYLYERIFGLPTDFSLLELSDTNNYLLRQLNLLAPGTFQHSLQVANLAEEAVFNIGGNALLTRTGALYHDIGKMENPVYYIENQVKGYNPHDELTTRESAAVIIGHVISGIEMARKKNLPEYLIDFIRTHHGTTTARYFYSRHLKESVSDEPVKSDFIYPGPKPFSRETAIVMMADSVEAASRSLEKPDEEQINRLVDNIIHTQMEEQQFENAPITFKDIETAKRIFKRRLLNIFHIRIAYPSPD